VAPVAEVRTAVPRRTGTRGRLWPWLASGLRLLLAAVLATAGALKLPDPAESVRAVRAYQLLPEAVVPTVGYALPLVELAVAALLALGLLTRWAAIVAALLMLAFCIGIASAWARGLTIECGCFGGGGQVAAQDTRYLPDLLRDGGLLLASLLLVARPASRFAVDTALFGPTTTAAA
jgi:uncharacterized membrane protein YphA (DoxX/SURF4 family)